MSSNDLTPRELADAIGASESSVRRWVDAGDVRLSRTSGGHRRIPVAEAIRFIRKSRATIVRPDLLGLPSLARKHEATGSEALTEMLRSGDGELARSLILSWFVSGQTAADIFDGPMRAALTTLGEIWLSDRCGILVEHRATEICVDAVTRLRQLIPVPDGNAPRALGAAIEGDFHLLPSLMAATVLREAGYADINYGANTPVDLLADAISLHHPRLVWICSSIEPGAKRVREMIDPLRTKLKRQHAALVLGGRLSAYAPTPDASMVNPIESMTALAGFASGLLAR